MDRQDRETRRAENQVWNGWGDYARKPELLTRDWYVDVDVSKYAAYFVVALNHDMSVSSIIDPIKKIEALLASRK